ncbi:hypothetical protein N658DRAFT_317016 [Parathielavia hyrcaniae]|uniref:Uncharacterized protein n=1 Tax=Parathielavia hyrcaniae TaxID=113614 RepID=A0AAN6PX23_9PEZI|nr:hypothetical protein N658DRAFT_317016 [Parathielavia hyrcaniae]
MRRQVRVTRSKRRSLVCLGQSKERTLTIKVVFADKRAADRGRTLQLIFHGTHNKLFISGAKMCQVLSLPDGGTLAELQREGKEDGGPLRWQLHPWKPEHLVGVSSCSATVFSWETLEPLYSIPLDLCQSTSSPDENRPPVSIDAILDSYSPHHLLLRTVSMVNNSERYSLLVLPTQKFYTGHASSFLSPPTAHLPGRNPAGSNTTGLAPLLFPGSLASKITHPLGILADGRLVFLDRQLRLCTTSLPRSASPRDVPRPGTTSSVGYAEPDVKRHFFIPQDWVTADDLRLCRVLRDGRFCVPPKGRLQFSEVIWCNWQKGAGRENI